MLLEQCWPNLPTNFQCLLNCLFICSNCWPNVENALPMFVKFHHQSCQTRNTWQSCKTLRLRRLFGVCFFSRATSVLAEGSLIFKEPIQMLSSPQEKQENRFKSLDSDTAAQRPPGGRQTSGEQLLRGNAGPPSTPPSCRQTNRGYFCMM